MANIVFDEQSAERIAKAVRWVEAQAIDESPDPQPLPSDEAATDLTTIVGTFSGEWAKGADKDVDYTDTSGTSLTQPATNYSADVGESGVTSDCVILKAGSAWVLVSASPATETVEVVTDVECVNNSLVITTETLRVPKQDS